MDFIFCKFRFPGTADYEAVPVLQETENTVISPDGGLLMPGIGSCYDTCFQIENAHPHRDKHMRRILRAQLGVYLRKDFGRCASRCRPGAEQIFHGHHKQRRRDPLA